MTSFSDNLRIPHLGQNIAEPEIPENTAKDIIDSFLSNTYQLETIDALDITINHTDSVTGASNWQSFVIEILDTGTFLTGDINVILPDNPRPYVFKNSTAYALTFKTAAGAGFPLLSSSNAYAYSDGSNIEKLEFAASGSGTTLEGMNDYLTTGYGSNGQALLSNGTNGFTLQDIISSVGLSDDVVPGYGSNGQVLVTNGTNAFTYSDVIANFIDLTDVDPTEYTLADVGKAIIVNSTYDGLEFGLAGFSLTGQNEITDAVDDYGYINTGTALINFSTDATTGTGLMYGTQGFVAIDTDVEFLNIDPSIGETLMLGANTKVTHEDASVTTLNNPEWIAQNAQRTADIALKNTMDINMAIDTLAKASKITLTAVGSETGAGEYTFVIAP